MSAWIDCPEQAPAPGWWWFRKPDSEDLNPVELWIDLKERHVVGPAAWTWGEWRRQGWQIWPTPIALPGAATAPEPLPRSTDQDLREWAEAATRSYRDSDAYDWPRGYRSAAAHVLAVLDAAGDEPDPEDVAGLGELVCDDQEIRTRLTRLEARERDVTNLLDEKDERLDALEKRVAAILASMEDGARQHRAADLAHLQASLASYGKRLDRAEQASAEQQKATAGALADLEGRLERQTASADFDGRIEPAVVQRGDAIVCKGCGMEIPLGEDFVCSCGHVYRVG